MARKRPAKSAAELIKRYATGEREFTGAVLRLADLDGCVLDGANLDNADLTGASLRDASLQSVFLRAAKLTEANLTHANLTGADLTGSDCSNANASAVMLERTLLCDCGLDGARLFNAWWAGATLEGARLSDRTGLNVSLFGESIFSARWEVLHWRTSPHLDLGELGEFRRHVRSGKGRTSLFRRYRKLAAGSTRSFHPAEPVVLQQLRVAALRHRELIVLARAYFTNHDEDPPTLVPTLKERMWKLAHAAKERNALSTADGSVSAFAGAKVKAYQQDVARRGTDAAARKRTATAKQRGDFPAAVIDQVLERMKGEPYYFAEGATHFTRRCFLGGLREMQREVSDGKLEWCDPVVKKVDISSVAKDGKKLSGAVRVTFDGGDTRTWPVYALRAAVAAHRHAAGA